jgi:pyruvate dehydrogenase E2 component (dihydrolipoamide acetyltransferase)
MTKPRSLYDVLAVLSAGATLLAGCADAPPPAAAAPVGGTEVPAAAAPAAAPAAATPAPAAAPAAAPAPAPAPAPAAAAAPAAASPKAMPKKIPNSKRTVDKSAAGCCGAGTCAPC